MRLLQLDDQHNVTLTYDLVDDIPPYAILSHTWGNAEDEVTFKDLAEGLGREKAGYRKIAFCGRQAQEDGTSHFWVDTCCIDRSSHTELSEAITSMFKWYSHAAKCYVYLSDVSVSSASDHDQIGSTWDQQFQKSRWFTRGWTLQELLAPDVVEFYSLEGQLLGDKKKLIDLIHEITGIPMNALSGTALSQYSRKERMRWAVNRQTKKPEDRAYCLLGIFEIFMPLIYGEGDNAFIRLEKSIAEQYGSTVDAAHEHWLVPRSAQPLFTGRVELLQSLENVIRETVYASHSDEQCRIVISGIGGQGKSEICLQLARRLRHIFWAVLWVDMSTTQTAERSFLDIAQTLSLPAQTWQQACSSLANLKHSWLLMLDNADSIDIDYLEYLPDSLLGVVILTTRNEECQQYATTPIVDLGGLDDDDACELLLKACRLTPSQQHQSDARTVASLLQCHALALLQAGAYIIRGHCRLVEYPQIYKQQRQRLMKFRPRQAQSRYRDVYTTFEVSVNMLKDMSEEAAQDALQLLPLLGVGGPNGLPLTVLFEAARQEAKSVLVDYQEDVANENLWLLTPWHVAQLPSLVYSQGADDDCHRLVEALSLLKAFSLVSFEMVDGSLLLSLHPLVHAWAWDRQSDIEQHQSWIQFGCLVALVYHATNLTPNNKRQLRAHVVALSEWPAEIMFAGETSSSVARILIRCGCFLRLFRADLKLRALIEKTFVALKLDGRTADRTYAHFYHLKAVHLRDSGRTQESIILFEQVVKMREHTIEDSTDPDQLELQHALGVMYQNVGRLNEAMALLEKVVRIRGQMLAENDPVRLASQRALARVYVLNKRGQEAVTILGQIVEIEKQLIYLDDRASLISRMTLAEAYVANGQVQEAITLLEQIIQIGDYLTEDDPFRLTLQYELGKAYEANGQFTEAITTLEQVIKIQAQSLAEDDRAQITSQQVLAQLYIENGQVTMAKRLIEKVISVQESSPNQNPLLNRFSQYLLSLYLLESGEYDRAITMMRGVVSQAREESDANHEIYEGRLTRAEKFLAEFRLS